MFSIDSNKVIHMTRGDVGILNITAKNNVGDLYNFVAGDIIRFKVFKKGDCNTLFILKDTTVNENTTNILITLDKDDTKIGNIINKPIDYWYEVELNPDTHPQTIIGYDSDGPKIFKLYPEGGGSI